jgi:hypothetical protein
MAKKNEKSRVHIFSVAEILRDPVTPIHVVSPGRQDALREEEREANQVRIARRRLQAEFDDIWNGNS